MKRLLPLVAVLAALAAAGGAWLLLRGDPPPPPPPPDPVSRTGRRKPPKDRPPEFVPADPDPGPETVPEEPVEPKEVPLPPDAYPWEVPGWWSEVDRRLREKEVVLDDEVRPVKDVLAFLEKEVLFPVRTGPELDAWASDHRITLPATRAPVRAILEALALRANVEVVLTADAVLLRQRGRAKEDRVTRAGRVQAAILESHERRAGKREVDAASADLARSSVDLALDGVPLREAARRLGERLSIPVYMDAGLWVANAPVRVEAGEKTLGTYLDGLAGAVGAAWDATPRRVVLFQPGR